MSQYKPFVPFWTYFFQYKTKLFISYSFLLRSGTVRPYGRLVLTSSDNFTTPQNVLTNGRRMARCLDCGSVEGIRVCLLAKENKVTFMCASSEERQ